MGGGGQISHACENSPRLSWFTQSGRKVIKTKIVFVLGAGASNPYELPLGNELYTAVIQDFSRNSEIREIRNEFFNTTPFNQTHVDNFINALKFSGFRSVDAFLEKREEFIEIGKAIMAIELLKRESHEVLWAVGNWMQYMYERLTADTLEEFGRNTVSFVTYNYDRTLEHFLHTSLMNTYGKGEEECKAALSHIDIIHLHGRLGYLPWQRQRDTIPFALKDITPQIVTACQREIHIVHENIEDRNTEFNVARRLLCEAQRIYFMGFGYARQNIDRLNLGELKPAIAEGTAFGLTEREQATIKSQISSSGGLNVTLHDMKCLEFLRARGDWS
jgi:hypothetical protein